MVKYLDFNDAFRAYGAGQQANERVFERKSLKDFARELEGGDYNAAAGKLAQMGDVNGALKTRNIPTSDEAGRLGNEYTQLRMDDVSTDNARQDADLNFRRQQGAQRNRLAEMRLNQGRQSGQLKPTANQKDYQFAVSQGFKGTMLEFQKASKQAGRGLTAGDRKAILEADEGAYAGQNVVRSIDAALALNDQSLSGYGAKTRAEIGSMFGHDASEATLEMDNLVVSRALESLKATFGGMPTEGERKILLEVQGSVNQAPDVREAIFNRAREAAERRIQYNQQRAEGVRSGEMYQPGYSQQQTQPQVQPPQAGQVEGGFQFMGGDPGDPSNWRKAE